MENALDLSTEEEQADSLLSQVVSDHPAAHELLLSPFTKSSRSIFDVAPEHVPDHLTVTTLAGPDLISSRPYVISNDEAGKLLAFYHLGRRLSGHNGIVHGGLVGILLDECMGRACFPKFQAKIGVTVKLEISYQAPIPVDSMVLVSAETADVRGRKAWVKATVEDVTPGRETKVLSQATAMFVEPRWASEMSKVIS
ncbi:hypothetical protein PV08_03504 [Exophiala spinifera]|uniref:Thioesterase domain-containing protein n=1 Tax=Exophiala spinifera TaxID=91928 RepID=A0A0D2BKT2_9EURO|nr:uncharacterized protein PV08_03504 [Exophiala spinifera]KIW19210.1 hypothetical protein PV08_03504 [Exophiala spinifera]